VTQIGRLPAARGALRGILPTALLFYVKFMQRKQRAVVIPYNAGSFARLNPGATVETLRKDRIMERKIAWTAAFALALGFSSAWAEDHEDETNDNAAFGAEVSAEAQNGGVDGQSVADRARQLGNAEATIAIIDDADAETAEAVTGEIPLPEELPEEAGFGNSVAVDARDGGVDGQEIAGNALDLASEMAGDALDNVEIPARSEVIPDVPDRPDLPEVPEMPEIPEPPAGS
jgi:hypothetical protein